MLSRRLVIKSVTCDGVGLRLVSLHTFASSSSSSRGPAGQIVHPRVQDGKERRLCRLQIVAQRSANDRQVLLSDALCHPNRLSLARFTHRLSIPLALLKRARHKQLGWQSKVRAQEARSITSRRVCSRAVYASSLAWASGAAWGGLLATPSHQSGTSACWLIVLGRQFQVPAT